MKKESIINAFYAITSNKYRKIHFCIAKEFNTTVRHVYRLKKGKTPRESIDYCILLKMKELRMIERVFYHGEI